MALLGIGVVMVHSAGMRIDDPSLANPWAVFTSKPFIYGALALAAFGLFSQLDAGWIFNRRTAMNPAVLGLLAAVALTGAAMIPGVGHQANGAWRWIKIGSFQFQPSELVKHGMVLALAWYAARRAGVLHKFFAGLLPALCLVALACGIVVLEDLGTAVLVGLVSMLLLWGAGARLWHLVLVSPLAIGGAAAMVVTSEYRVRRITAFLDPWADPGGTGFHPIQSMLAFAGGGPTGRGLGNGIQKFGYVPEDTTDFIFTVIAEELGVAGCGVVVVLFMVILWTGMQVVRESRDPFARILAMGVTLTVVIQASINIAVVTVVVPTKGIALPLISNGGTGWILTAAALGMVAAIDNANHVARRGTDAEVIEEAWDGDEDEADQYEEDQYEEEIEAGYEEDDAYAYDEEMVVA